MRHLHAYSPARLLSDNATFDHGKIRAEGALPICLRETRDPDIHCF